MLTLHPEDWRAPGTPGDGGSRGLPGGGEGAVEPKPVVPIECWEAGDGAPCPQAQDPPSSVCPGRSGARSRIARFLCPVRRLPGSRREQVLRDLGSHPPEASGPSEQAPGSLAQNHHLCWQCGLLGPLGKGVPLPGPAVAPKPTSIPMSGHPGSCRRRRGQGKRAVRRAVNTSFSISTPRSVSRPAPCPQRRCCGAVTSAANLGGQTAGEGGRLAGQQRAQTVPHPHRQVAWPGVPRTGVGVVGPHAAGGLCE